MRKIGRNQIIVFLIVMAFFSAKPCVAQRTSDGQLVGTVAVGTNFTSVISDGELSFGRYFLYSMAEGGVLLSNMSMSVTNGETIGFLRIEGFGKWMWRAYSTYPRNFNVYLGGDVFAGVELMDPFAIVQETTYKAFLYAGYKDLVAIYGLAPRAEMEYFPFDRVALFVSQRVPLTFGSQYSEIVISASTRFGVRYNF